MYTDLRTRETQPRFWATLSQSRDSGDWKDAAPSSSIKPEDRPKATNTLARITTSHPMRDGAEFDCRFAGPDALVKPLPNSHVDFRARFCLMSAIVDRPGQEIEPVALEEWPVVAVATTDGVLQTNFPVSKRTRICSARSSTRSGMIGWTDERASLPP
jgi:hypothetical protein